AFAATRAAVPPHQAGKALAGVNLSFFAGAAILQVASGPVAAAAGTGAGLLFFSVAAAACTLAYAMMTRRDEKAAAR
ncbi:hypothetical protein Q0M19_14075, partial [Staphylococcus aureus]|nr:hypothetical protein [Staphylococcus aureus]